MSLGSVVQTFQSIEYRISASAQSDVLTVEVSGPSTSWMSKFTARFIEDVTQRTGSAKSFSTFCRMLSSAFTGNPSVTLDLLTADDLDKLRGRSSGTRDVDKRYLIVTFSSEFEDKVHYPLALTERQHVGTTHIIPHATYSTQQAPSLACSNPSCMATIANLQSHINSALARESTTRSSFSRTVRAICFKREQQILRI
jgi:hypothetical protein